MDINVLHEFVFAEILHSFFPLRKETKMLLKNTPNKKERKKIKTKQKQKQKKQQKNKTIEELKLSEFHCISHQ